MGATFSQAASNPPSSLPASSWILVDMGSGDVLAAQNPKAAYPVASATKLMTYYVSAEQLRPRRKVVVAPYDPAPGESLAGLEPGDTLTARDILYGLMLPSGNEAALTLALAVSGSESDFVSRMNASAADLGLAETEYVDPIGLSPGNVSSARDLVNLAIELRDQELFQEIVDTPRITLKSGAQPLRIENRNALVLEVPFIDGIKTGTTLEAGYVLVGSGTRKGVPLVSAILGAPDAASRDAATLELFEYGFSLYERRLIVKAGKRLGSAPLADGGRIPLEAATDLEAVARADQEVEIRLADVAPVVAPVSEGEAVGLALVRLDGRSVGTVGAVATRSVAELAEAKERSSGVPRWVWSAFGTAALLASAFAVLAIRVHRRPEQ